MTCGPRFNGFWFLLFMNLCFRTRTEAFSACQRKHGPFSAEPCIFNNGDKKSNKYRLTDIQYSGRHFRLTSPIRPSHLQSFAIHKETSRRIPWRQTPFRSWTSERRIRPPRKLLRGLVAFAILTAVFSLLPQSARGASSHLAMEHSARNVIESVSSSPTASVARIVAQSPDNLPLIWQVRLSLRLLAAGFMGGAIGKERAQRYKQADKIMGMVALGAAMFTICSIIGFAGTNYDASRMASTVASGVGFIGAGVIYHDPFDPGHIELSKEEIDEPKNDMVHGLTTSAAIFISAAIGVACGVGLYIISGVSTLATLAILRIGGNVKHRSHERRRYERLQREKALLIQERMKSLQDFEKLKQMERLWREQQSQMKDAFETGAVRHKFSVGRAAPLVESHHFSKASRGTKPT